MRRAVGITGIGIVAPTGVGKETFQDALIHGRPVIRRISRFDASSYPSQIAAEVDDECFRDLLPPGKQRTAARTSLFAIAATKLALDDARLNLDFVDPHQRGVVMGTSLGGWSEAQQQFAVLLERGANRVNPFLLNGSANHAPAMEVAVLANAQGTHATFSTGCCASMHAIGHAADLVARGEVEICLTGGTEAPISPLVLAAMCRTGELCCVTDDVEHASRPFDRDHSGIVLSEGSAVFVLEPIERARERNAPVYAQVLSHASSMDATDIFRVDRSGAAGARAIQDCLVRSELSVPDIDYVCAHGNAAPHFDRKETAVLKRAFGECAARLPVSSIKGVLGHAFGASSAFQVAAASLAILNQLIPPTHNLENPDPECDLDYVPNVARRARLRNVLVCSYGFGGINACIALRAGDASQVG